MRESQLYEENKSKLFDGEKELTKKRQRKETKTKNKTKTYKFADKLTFRHASLL